MTQINHRWVWQLPIFNPFVIQGRLKSLRSILFSIILFKIIYISIYVQVLKGQRWSNKKYEQNFEKSFFEKMWCEMVVRDGGVVISSVNI